MWPAASLAVSASNRSRVRLFAPTDSASAGSSVSVSEPLLRISVCVGCSCTPGGMTAACAPTAQARAAAAVMSWIFFILEFSRWNSGSRHFVRIDVNVAPEGIGERMPFVPDQPGLPQVGADAVDADLVRHVRDHDARGFADH